MKPTRRSFLKTSLACAGATVAAPAVFSQSIQGANDKIRLAWIGLGMQGQSDLSSCSRDCEVVAVCDCDSKNAAKVLSRADKRGYKVYKDFRVMFEEMGDQIDAVGISTPDHTHFAAAYMAVNLGKHVFVQKPLTHSLWEARTLTELAAEKGVVTQMGNQGQAHEGARLVKGGLHKDWINAIKEGRKACSDFSYAGPLTELIFLGTLAIRTGKTVKLDGDAMKIVGNPEAAALIKTEARRGWDIKDLS